MTLIALKKQTNCVLLCAKTHINALEFTGTCFYVDCEQQPEDQVPSNEETVELRMWNQASDASEDDTEVSIHQQMIN